MDTLTRDSEVIQAALRDSAAEDVRVHLVLPRQVAALVDELLQACRTGGAVVVPANRDLTPAEAARVLGVSRPTVYRYLDNGLLDHHLVGRHRRIPAASLKAFQASEQKRQRQALDRLMELSDEYGYTE